MTCTRAPRSTFTIPASGTFGNGSASRQDTVNSIRCRCALEIAAPSPEGSGSSTLDPALRLRHIERRTLVDDRARCPWRRLVSQWLVGARTRRLGHVGARLSLLNTPVPH